MSDSLYHHGVPKQKWGLRRYQNPDGSLTPLGRIHYGVKGVRKTKQSDRTKPSSKPKLKPEQTTLDNDAIKNDPALMKKLGENISNKRKLKYVDAVRSGNKRQIKKVERHLSNEELKSALERIDLNYKLDDMKKARKASNLKRAKENVDNIATAADKVASLYNIVAGVSQAVDFLPDLPKINTKPTDPLDRQKKQLALETERLKRDKALLEKEEAERKQADAAEERLDKELKKERNREKDINDKINKIDKDIEESRKKTEEAINDIKNETVKKPDIPESDDPWAYNNQDIIYKTNSDNTGWGKNSDTLWKEDLKSEVENHLDRLDGRYDAASYREFVNKAIKSSDELRDLKTARQTMYDASETGMQFSTKEKADLQSALNEKAAEYETNVAIAKLYGQNASNDSNYLKYSQKIRRENREAKRDYDKQTSEYENAIKKAEANTREANQHFERLGRQLADARKNGYEDIDINMRYAEAMSAKKNVEYNLESLRERYAEHIASNKPKDRKILSKDEYTKKLVNDRESTKQSLLNKIDSSKYIGSKSKSNARYKNAIKNTTLLNEILNAFNAADGKTLTKNDLSKEAYEYYITHKLYYNDETDIENLLHSLMSKQVYEG